MVDHSVHSREQSHEAQSTVEQSIAVVVPMHNAEQWIEECIASIRAQSLPVSELVIVDDGSTDASVSRARLFAPQSATFIQNSIALGPAAARNQGWRSVRSEWVAFIDADDVWHPGHLQLLASASQDADIIFSQVRIFSSPHVPMPWPTLPASSPRAIVNEAFGRKLFEMNIIPQSAVLVRRSALAEADGYDEELWVGEDYDLWLRLLTLSARFADVPTPSVARREHPTQLSYTKLRSFLTQRWASRQRFLAKLSTEARSSSTWISTITSAAERELVDAWHSRDTDLLDAAVKVVSGFPETAALLPRWRWRNRVFPLYRLAQRVYDRLPNTILEIIRVRRRLPDPNRGIGG